MTRITETLHEGVCTLTLISRSILLRMKNFWTTVVDKIKTHFMLKTFSRRSCFYELMLKNMVQPNRLQNTK